VALTSLCHALTFTWRSGTFSSSLFYVDSTGFVSPKFIISGLLHGILIDSAPVQYFQVNKSKICDPATWSLCFARILVSLSRWRWCTSESRGGRWGAPIWEKKIKKQNLKVQLNFVKANFIKTNNSLRRSESSFPNRVLLILTKIQLFNSKNLCRTFYVSKHIVRSRSGVFFIKSNG